MHEFATLTAEVAALRQLVDSLKKEKTSMPPKRTYARAALTTASTTSSNSAKIAATTLSVNPPKASKSDHPRRSHDSSSRVKVDGARRIWGTVPTCSAGAIVATISKLIPNNLQLRVRRKTKMAGSNKVLWWFVVHGAESDLITLEQNWEKVQTQTCWSLQNCYMPSQTNISQVATPDLPQHTSHAEVSSAETPQSLPLSTFKAAEGNEANDPMDPAAINVMTPNNRSTPSQHF